MEHGLPLWQATGNQLSQQPGGNASLANGSARGRTFAGMDRFNSYAGAIGTVDSHCYQDASDFDDQSPVLLPGLK